MAGRGRQWQVSLTTALRSLRFMELIVRKEKQLKVQRENFKTSLTRIKSMSLAELLDVA